MNDHSGEIFVHSVKQVKYIEVNKFMLEESGKSWTEQMALFAEMVNAAIKEGWEPIGSPVYAGRDKEIPDLIQMMVKR